jgi:hypothetical protein
MTRAEERLLSVRTRNKVVFLKANAIAIGNLENPSGKYFFQKNSVILAPPNEEKMT